MFILRVVQDTFLKLEAKPSSDLADDQKYLIEAGKEFPVVNFHEFDDIHFRLAFGKDDQGNQIFFPGPDGQGRNAWLIFEGHCALLNNDGTPALQFFSKVPLKLQDVLAQDLRFSMDAVATNKVLAAQIQDRLIYLGLLSSVQDGDFGPVSADALRTFQKLMKLGEKDFLGKETAEKLIETDVKDVQPPLNLGDDLASRIIKYMQAKGYKVALGANEYNIVYLEGANEDGTPNSDQPNHFNDRRILIKFENSTPKIVGNWEATTEPGSHYTHKPISDYARKYGAARIKFGQYKAWQVGPHGTADPHEGLVQRGTISVHRDLNKDFMRSNDLIDTGSGFGVNQHWGYDYPTNDIKAASAGCLVGRERKGHKEFMALVKKDQRYVVNGRYVFETAVIPGDDLHQQFPPR